MCTRTLFIVFTVFLFASSITAQTENWITVSPPLTAFLIKMPSQPEKKVEGGITKYFYSAYPNSNKWLFTGLAFDNLPLGAGDVEATLRKEIEDFAKEFDGKIISTARRDYKQDSPMKQALPGMEAKVKHEDGVCLVAAYVVRPKAYVMTYCAANERYSQAEAERFLDSFVLLRY